MAENASDDKAPMRERIKALALDLLIQHGYRGVSFGILAKLLGTTRANIHYHFGNKESLVEEVLEDYVAMTLSALKEVWTTPGRSITNKIAVMVEHSRKRYLRYNPPGHEGKPLSLIARMRQDSDVLTPKGRAALQRFSRELEECFIHAIEDAKARHELSAATPVSDVALQLAAIANSAGPITQDAGDFDRLEQLYAAFTRTLMIAFGHEPIARAVASS